MRIAVPHRVIRLAAWVALGAAVASPASAAQIYLCKSYSGGQFWSNTVCSSQQATLVRIVEVPDRMPFEQQVQIGMQVHAEREALRQPNAGRPAAQVYESQVRPSAPNGVALCQALESQVQSLDAQARQPQTAQTHDRIRAARQEARNRQAQLGCRGS